MYMYMYSRIRKDVKRPVQTVLTKDGPYLLTVEDFCNSQRQSYYFCKNGFGGNPHFKEREWEDF